MKDKNQLEKNITKELKSLVGKRFEWVEWSSSKEQVEKNLVDGEKMIKLPYGGIWVAYRNKA